MHPPRLGTGRARREALSPVIHAVRPGDWFWKNGGGYYTRTADELKRQPALPDFRRLRNRSVFALFAQYTGLRHGARVLEVGCGSSEWLPQLALATGCMVVGVDIEPFAAELASANLHGAGVGGRILCRDAFDLEQNAELKGRFDLVYSMGVMEHFRDVVERLAVIREYLRKGGRILTTVPNLHGINWFLQRLASREVLEMHVIHTAETLVRAHEAAGFKTVRSGYVGFYDGFLTDAGRNTGRINRTIHRWLCWLTSMSSEAWLRIGREAGAPELPWLAPHIYYVGTRT